MFGPWQPYPDHPRVQALTRGADELQDRALKAAAAGNLAEVRSLVEQRQALLDRLAEVTAGLLDDPGLSPRWVAHSAADAAAGGVECLACGNNVRAGETCCTYCGWTYALEPAVSAGNE